MAGLGKPAGCAFSTRPRCYGVPPLGSISRQIMASVEARARGAVHADFDGLDSQFSMSEIRRHGLWQA